MQILPNNIASIRSNTTPALLITSSGTSIDSLGSSGGGGGGSAGVASLNGLTGTLSLVGGSEISIATGTTTLTINYTGTVGDVNGPTGSFTNSLAVWSGNAGNQLMSSKATVDVAGNSNFSSGTMTVGTVTGGVVTVEATQFNVLAPGDIYTSISVGAGTTNFGNDFIVLTNPTGLMVPNQSGNFGIGTLTQPVASGQFVNLNAQNLTVNGNPVLTSDSWIPTLGVNSITGTVASFTNLTGNTFNFTRATGIVENVNVLNATSITGSTIYQGANQVINTVTGLGTVSVVSTTNGFVTLSGTAYSLPSFIASLGIGQLTGTNASFAALTGTVFNFTSETGTTSTIGTLIAGTGTATLVNSLQYETTQASGNTTATSYTINWNSGTAQVLSFFGAGTGCTITLSNGIAGSTYTLETINNTTGTTNVTWPTTSMKWLGGATGTMTQSGTAIDVFIFQYDGLRYLGNAANNYL